MAGELLRLKVTSNMRQVLEGYRGRGLTREEQLRSAARAMNRCADTARTEASRMIRKRYKVSNQKVLKAIGIRYATPEHLSCVLTVRGRPLSVAGFKASQTRKGVGVSITASRKTIKGAFLRTLPKKTAEDDTYDIVFERKGRARYPLRAIKTVDTPGMFSRDEVLVALEKAVDAKFNAEFVRQLNLILKG